MSICYCTNRGDNYHSLGAAGCAAALGSTPPMSKRDELAAVLGESLCPSWHRQGWVSSIVGKPMESGPRAVCPAHASQASGAAGAVLAWLGGQFDEGLRARVAEAISCEADWDVSGLGSADFGVIREMREHLGLEEAAQNAQDAP